MSYGAQVWSETGQTWVDVVQPTWILDFINGASGSGTLNYGIDTSRFHLKVIVLNYTLYVRESAPVINVSGGSVSYSLPSSCIFLVAMEAN